MINLYCRERCASSHKAKNWLEKYGIDFRMKSPCQISRNELITVFASTSKGVFEAVKDIHKVTDRDRVKIQSMKTMTLNQAIEFLKLNPNLLKTPIVIEKSKVMVGYNSEQIRMFLPKMYRQSTLVDYSRGMEELNY